MNLDQKICFEFCAVLSLNWLVLTLFLRYFNSVAPSIYLRVWKMHHKQKVLTRLLAQKERVIWISESSEIRFTSVFWRNLRVPSVWHMNRNMIHFSVSVCQREQVCSTNTQQDTLSLWADSHQLHRTVAVRRYTDSKCTVKKRTDYNMIPKAVMEYNRVHLLK